MRFFTNESKDDQNDPKDVDVQDREGHQPDGGYHSDDKPDTVQSDPVAVPQQRASSPWSSTPDETDRDDSDPVNGHDTTTTTTDESNRVDEALDDRDRLDDHDVAETHDDHDAVETHEDPTPPDHAVADTSPEATTTTYGPDGVVTRSDEDTTDADDTVDSSDKVDTDEALKDDGDFDDPQAVDPVTDETLDDKDEDEDDDKDKSDEVVAVADADDHDEVAAPAEAVTPVAVATESPAQTKPSETATAGVTSLFGDDAQSFQDRWRDVQLRFVDNPQEATAEAAGLVDEAVEKLTAGLKAQKDQFSGDSSEDTEKLRVELRGYRDILNRIIAL